MNYEQCCSNKAMHLEGMRKWFGFADCGSLAKFRTWKRSNLKFGVGQQTRVHFVWSAAWNPADSLNGIYMCHASLPQGQIFVTYCIESK
jgi:hypothetical protein